MKNTLNGRNKIMAMKTWLVSVMRYGACIVNQAKSELDEIDRKTRKVMTMNKELYPKVMLTCCMYLGPKEDGD